MINVAVIGCGRIGEKRALAMQGLANIEICYDSNFEFSKEFSKKNSCRAASSLNEIFENQNIDAVFIATPHDSLALLASQAINSDKHVFIEKPGAINHSEFSKVIDLQVDGKPILHVGYNHRYHRSLRKALSLTESGEIGKVLFIRARYGHGGRLGYEKEWRAKKEISGGGELIDQGTHLLDLCQAFLGDLILDYGATPNFFWNMSVEDNAFMVVKNAFGSIGFLHASCTEWKNTFSFEVYGELGKLEISGLGGSYGIEKLTHYKMLPEMGPPCTYSWEFPMPDDSWRLEVQNFVNDINLGTNISDNRLSALKVLKLVEEIYERSGR